MNLFKRKPVLPRACREHFFLVFSEGNPCRRCFFKWDGTIVASLIFLLFLVPHISYAAMVFTASPYTPPATDIEYTGGGGGDKFLYKNSTGGAICASNGSGYSGTGEVNAFCSGRTYNGGFDNTATGTYQWLNVNSVLCSASDSFATCRGENLDAGGSQLAEFVIADAGGGGGGGGGATTTPSTIGYLPTQQEDLFMFGIVSFLLACIAFRTLFFTV